MALTGGSGPRDEGRRWRLEQESLPNLTIPGQSPGLCVHDSCAFLCLFWAEFALICVCLF